MLGHYGQRRVAEGQNTLPIMAWKLDNSEALGDDELMLSVEKIHVEQKSLKQIMISAGRYENKIKERIMDIVEDRGKLHNPFTNTGGTIYGRVKKIGRNYEREVELGEPVVVATSATMVPLYIEEIRSIDYIYGIIDVKGYCILCNDYHFVRKPGAKSLEILMLGFEESASLYNAHEMAKKFRGKNFLISGNNLVLSMMYACSIRKAIGNDCSLTGLFYPEFDAPVDKGALLPCLETEFDHIHIIDPENLLSEGEEILNAQEEKFDLCINCSDLIDSELLDVLALKEGGTMFFSSIMNDYQMALFFSEGISKGINIVGAFGYMDGYKDFTQEFIAESGDAVIRLAEKMYDMEKKPVEHYIANLSRQHSKEISDISGLYDFIYVSDQMKEVVSKIVNVARYDCSVLISGETGVGKEKVAELLHSFSTRKGEPCISVNCGAIPENLMEMEFFGYEKGSFTGASSEGKKGYFEAASKGILFLDEIGEMNLLMQAKLLRVLQEKEFYRIGGNTPVRTNARIIASTNKDLKRMVEEGKFRDDLYYRLMVASVEVPPLRQRPEDIVPVAEFFVKKYNERYDMNKRIEPAGMGLLLEYDWPGNVRELENLIQRVLINTTGNVASALQIAAEIMKSQEQKGGRDKPATEQHQWSAPAATERFDKETFASYVCEMEKEFLAYHLKKHKTTRKTAEMLGMSQSQLMRKKKKYGL